MTFREKLKMEHPDRVDDRLVCGCRGCPEDYGYEVRSDCEHTNRSCTACWDHEMPKKGLNEWFHRYEHSEEKEPLILEPEDWTAEEWKTIEKLFGMTSAERIKVSNYTLETYGKRRLQTGDTITLTAVNHDAISVIVNNGEAQGSLSFNFNTDATTREQMLISLCIALGFRPSKTLNIDYLNTGGNDG